MSDDEAKRGSVPWRHTVFWEVAKWLMATTLASSAIFFLLTRINEQSGDARLWEVTRSTVALTALIGGAVAIAVNIRRQKTTEESHRLALAQDDLDRVSRLRERFTVAADQIGNESAAVRMAGVYAVAALADDWHDRGNRREAQVCIDLLCSYIRMPRKDPIVNGTKVTPGQEAETEIRTTIMAVIRDRLIVHQDNGAENPRWAGYNLDFRSARFDHGAYSLADATIVDATVTFERAIFSAGDFNLSRMQVQRSTIEFALARFTGSIVLLHKTRIREGVVSFHHAALRDGVIHFTNSRFTQSLLSCEQASLEGGGLSFDNCEFNHAPSFEGTKFCGSSVAFRQASITTEGSRFTASGNPFRGAMFESGTVDFNNARFAGAFTFDLATCDRLTMDFTDADFTTGSLRFIGLVESPDSQIIGPWGSRAPDLWPPPTSD